VSLTLLLVAVALTMVAPRLFSNDHAASARSSQIALELSSTAVVDLKNLTGTYPTETEIYNEMVPRVSFLDELSASRADNEVSIAVRASHVALASEDTAGWCWMLIRYTGTDARTDEMKLAVQDTSCTGATASSYASSVPGNGLGGSWTTVWAP
jgi:hypothetical protein